MKVYPFPLNCDRNKISNTVRFCEILPYFKISFVFWPRILMGRIFSRRHLEIFYFYFSQKTEFDIYCKLSPLHEMSNPVFWEKKTNITNLSSAGKRGGEERGKG